MIEQRSQVGIEMEQRADHFRVAYGQYFRNQISEKELTEQTTQPFWESLRLSRHRLDEKGLALDVTIYNDTKKRTDPQGEVRPGKDGWNYTGTSTKAVWTERKFQKSGKIIYQKKEHEISNVSLLKSDVQGEMAHCPNCGNVGKISTFIDGCDYCDSKFLVSDFETKISGFSLEENVYKTVLRIFNRTVLTVFFLSLLFMILFFGAGLVTMFLFTMGKNGTEVLMSVGLMVYAIDSIPVYGRILFISLWLYFIGKAVLNLLYHKVISGEETVKTVIPNFSAYDFYQNLEYKLRNIHLTNQVEAVQAFGDFDFGPILAKYEDVVDCALTGLKFLDAWEEREEQRYGVRVEARVKLTLYGKGKISVRYERLNLELTGACEMLEHNCNAIREYKCQGCGASVDILSGGVCEHCGSRLDYSRYGWMLRKYESGKKFADIRRRVRLAVVVMFLAIAAGNIYHFLHEPADDSMSWGEVFQMLSHTEEILDEYFAEIPKPSDTDGSVTLISEETGAVFLKRTYLYRAEDIEKAFADYTDYLHKSGCFGGREDSGSLNARFYLAVETDIDDVGGIAIIDVAAEEGFLKVIVELTDEMPQENGLNPGQE